MTTSEYIKQKAIENSAKGIISWVPDWIYSWIKKDCGDMKLESKNSFLSSMPVVPGKYVGGFFDHEQRMGFIYASTEQQHKQNEPYHRLVQQNKTKYENGFFIVAGDSILCDFKNNFKVSMEFINIDELKTHQHAKPFLLEDKENASWHMKWSRKNIQYKVLNYAEFVEEFDCDFCHYCGSINTKWDGHSGDGGSYVGYQECSWLTCNTCGHQSDAE